MTSSASLAPIEVQRRRIKHQANNRGMKENDIILGTFAERHLATMSQQELDQFDKICEQIDPDIWGWLTGSIPIPDELNTPVMAKLRQHLNTNPLNYRSK